MDIHESQVSATPGIINNLNECQSQLNKSLAEGNFEQSFSYLQQMANELTVGITDEEFKQFDDEIFELKNEIVKATTFSKSLNRWSFPSIRNNLKNRISFWNRKLIRVRNKLNLGIDISKTKKLKR